MAEELKITLDPIERESIDLPQKGFGSSLQSIIPQGTPEPIDFEEEKKLAFSAKGSNLGELKHPIDKINTYAFNFEEADETGIIEKALKIEGNKSKKQATLFYTANFNALEELGFETVKRLTAKDRLIYNAVCTLYEAGYHIISDTMIYRLIGGKGKPGKSDRDFIFREMLKMGSIYVTYDNIEEHNLYGEKIELIQEGRHPIELKYKSAIANGKRVENAYYISETPFLYKISSAKNQITAYPSEAYAIPLNRTEQTVEIMLYLLDRISHIRNKTPNYSKKITFNSIFEKAHITEKMERSRAKNKIQVMLEHWQKKEIFSKFTVEKDYILIEP